MNCIRYTSQYKKDLKRFLNQPKKLKSLQLFIDKLKNKEPLESKYRLHPLKKEFPCCWECNIDGDFLLFYEANYTIVLMRLSSHYDLFKTKSLNNGDNLHNKNKEETMTLNHWVAGSNPVYRSFVLHF